MSKFIYKFFDDKSEFSSKKMIAYVFCIVVMYLAIFTDKQYYDILIFITALLGLRTYETTNRSNNNNTPTL